MTRSESQSPGPGMHATNWALKEIKISVRNLSLLLFKVTSGTQTTRCRLWKTSVFVSIMWWRAQTQHPLPSVLLNADCSMKWCYPASLQRAPWGVRLQQETMTSPSAVRTALHQWTVTWTCQCLHLSSQLCFPVDSVISLHSPCWCWYKMSTFTF